MTLVTDIVSLFFILPGAFMVFSAAVGTVRFGTTLARVHAITKPQTTGLLLMMIGTIIRLTGAPDFGPHEQGDIGDDDSAGHLCADDEPCDRAAPRPHRAHRGSVRPRG